MSTASNIFIGLGILCLIGFWFLVRTLIKEGHIKTGFPKLYLLGKEYESFKD